MSNINERCSAFHKFEDICKILNDAIKGLSKNSPSETESQDPVFICEKLKNIFPFLNLQAWIFDSMDDVCGILGIKDVKDDVNDGVGYHHQHDDDILGECYCHVLEGKPSKANCKSHVHECVCKPLEEFLRAKQFLPLPQGQPAPTGRSNVDVCNCIGLKCVYAFLKSIVREEIFKNYSASDIWRREGRWLPPVTHKKENKEVYYQCVLVKTILALQGMLAETVRLRSQWSLRNNRSGVDSGISSQSAISDLATVFDKLFCDMFPETSHFSNSVQVKNSGGRDWFGNFLRAFNGNKLELNILGRVRLQFSGGVPVCNGFGVVKYLFRIIDLLKRSLLDGDFRLAEESEIVDMTFYQADLVMLGTASKNSERTYNMLEYFGQLGRVIRAKTLHFEYGFSSNIANTCMLLANILWRMLHFWIACERGVDVFASERLKRIGCDRLELDNAVQLCGGYELARNDMPCIDLPLIDRAHQCVKEAVNDLETATEMDQKKFATPAILRTLTSFDSCIDDALYASQRLIKYGICNEKAEEKEVDTQDKEGSKEGEEVHKQERVSVISLGYKGLLDAFSKIFSEREGYFEDLLTEVVNNKPIGLQLFLQSRSSRCSFAKVQYNITALFRMTISDTVVIQFLLDLLKSLQATLDTSKPTPDGERGKTQEIRELLKDNTQVRLDSKFASRREHWLKVNVDAFKYYEEVSSDITKGSLQMDYTLYLAVKDICRCLAFAFTKAIGFHTFQAIKRKEVLKHGSIVKPEGRFLTRGAFWKWHVEELIGNSD